MLIITPGEIGNVGFACKKHALVKGKFVGYAPSLFMGKYVKIGFRIKNRKPEDPKTENMWILVKNYHDDKKRFRGTLENDPAHPNLAVKFKCGDTVYFGIRDILDVAMG